MSKPNVKNIVNLTQKLISFKTITSDLDSNKRAFEFLEKYLTDQKMIVEKFNKNGHPNLVIKNRKFFKNEADIILQGHIDVVPASDEEFKTRIIGDKLFGRGACDMLGGTATLIELLNSLKIQGLQKNILLLITSDEEIGGTDGTEFLIKDKGYRGKFFITAEGEKNYLLKYIQKGVLMFKLKSSGTGEHSSYTWAGDNAIKKLFKAYQEIEKLFPEKQNDKKHWYTTINLGTIKGGLATNSIPEYSEAQIDIRFSEDFKSTEEILKKIQAAVKKISGIKIEVLYKSEMMNGETKNRYLASLNEIAKKHLNLKSDLYFKNHGTNDARFASQVGIPAVGFGPIGGNYHAKGEFVYISSLEKYFNILEEFIQSI